MTLPVTMQLAESLRVLRTFSGSIPEGDRGHCEALVDAALERYEAAKAAHRPQLAPIPSYEALADREAFGNAALCRVVTGLLDQIEALGLGASSPLVPHLHAVRAVMPSVPRTATWMGPPIRLHTWEMTADPTSVVNLTDEQRRPFKVDVAIDTSSVAVTMTRIDACGAEEEDVGLSLMIEVSAGRPAVHFGPGPLAEHVCHAHVVAPNAIEVAPDSGTPECVPSTPYGSTVAYKYSS